MDRRTFVKSAAAGAAGVAFWGLGETVAANGGHVVPPSDQIRVGVIGVGSRGQWVMRRMLRVPGVHVAALCDVYEPRFAEGRDVTGEETPAYTDYRRMLEGEELDVVLVASPLRYHAEHVVAALESGCHVYGEKSMGYSLEDCNQIVDAVERTGRRFQVGHQFRYAPWCEEAVRRIEAGEIGEVTHIFAYWHRNNNWRRPLPDDPPAGWTEKELERLINWRMYLDYSRGLLAELGSHHIDIANWIFNAQPEAVVGSGGIVYYDDGRETYDNVQAVFDYPGGRRLTFSSMLNNGKLGYRIEVYGTGGTVHITLEDATFFYEPELSDSAVPEDRSAIPDSLIQQGFVTGPTLGTKGDMPYRGPGVPVRVPDNAESPDHRAVTSFFDSLRNDERPFTDEHVGRNSAVPVVFAHRAIHERCRIAFGEHMTPALQEDG